MQFLRHPHSCETADCTVCAAAQCLLCCCTVQCSVSFAAAQCLLCKSAGEMQHVRPHLEQGGKFNDSNGSLKESGLISHSTGTGHHPQSRHQTLISFYSIPTAKTQCSRREDKKALRKRVTFQDGCVMGPVGMSLKMCLFFFSIGWRGARDALSQTCRGTFCLSLQPLLLARMSFGLRAFVSNSVFNTSRIPARVPITTAFAHRAKHGR